MICIRETDLPNSVIVSQLDKNIGAVNSNNVDTRTFVFNRVFKGLDLSLGEYIAVAQIQTSNKEKDPFYAPLSKTVFENEVHYILKITREICSDVGALLLNLSIKSIDEDIDYFSYIMQFIVSPNINANKSLEKIDRNILETYVIEAATYAQNAAAEADRAQQIADNIYAQIGDLNDLNTNEKDTIVGAINELKQDIENIEIGDIDVIKSNIFKDSYLEFPSIGDATILYIDISNNRIYRWDNVNLKYYIIGSNYSEIKIINGGNSSDG